MELENKELTFVKSTNIGDIIYRRITTTVSIMDTGLGIEKKTKKIFRKEKVEERTIPFVEISSAAIHTVFDYWDTVYAIVAALIGFLYHPAFFLAAAVILWCGYGKKIQLLLSSGEKYAIPYKFGKDAGEALVNICNKTS